MIGDELPVLARGFAFACRLDGREKHGLVAAMDLLSFFCNCSSCCAGRKRMGHYPPEYLGMIAVRVAKTRG